MRRLLILLALLALCVPAFAAESAAFGYVDIEKVLGESDAGQKAAADLEAKYGADREALLAEEQAIRQLQQTLARDQALMSQDELEKRTEEIQKRVIEVQKKAGELQQKVNEEQVVVADQILKSVQEISGALAKERKLSAIFTRERSGFVYVDDSLNLTNEVIKRLNAKK